MIKNDKISNQVQSPTCGNIFKGDELGAPETGVAVAPPVSIGWLVGGRATGAATSVVSGIP